jgi:hypothetical protein
LANAAGLHARGRRNETSIRNWTKDYRIGPACEAAGKAIPPSGNENHPEGM